MQRLSPTSGRVFAPGTSPSVDGLNAILVDNLNETARKRWIALPSGAKALDGSGTVGFLVAEVEQAAARNVTLRLLINDFGPLESQPPASSSPSTAAGGSCPAFGTRLAIPQEFKKVSSAQQPSGEYWDVWQTPDALRIVIKRGCLGGSVPTIEELWTRENNPDKDIRITYKKRGKDWFATSGYVTKLIFYSKTVVSGERWAQFRMFWSEDQRAEYDPLISKIEKSFAITE